MKDQATEQQGTASLPHGWALVPRRPTAAMLQAVDDLDEDKYVARGHAVEAWHAMFDAAPTEAPVTSAESLLREVLAAQMISPYRGWNMTRLNKAVDLARSFLRMPSIREMNPDIAKMQDHIATNPDALAQLMGGTGS